MLSRVWTHFRYVWLSRSTKIYLEELLAGPLTYTMWGRIGHPQHVKRFHNLMCKCTSLICMWLHIVTSWDTLSVRVAPAKYETIPCRITGRPPNIHKVLSDRSPIARETVPQLGMRVHGNAMYVDTYFSRVGTHFRHVLLSRSTKIYLGELLAGPLKYTRCYLIDRP
jgi:hypothetical protein